MKIDASDVIDNASRCPQCFQRALQEVETLFHEAGHCLQHMLTEQDEGLVSGIRGIEWDAVRRLRLLLLSSVPPLCLHVPDTHSSLQGTSWACLKLLLLIRFCWSCIMGAETPALHGTGGAAIAVHGELVLPPRHAELFRKALREQ